MAKSPIGNPWPAILPALALSAVFFLMPIVNMIGLSLTTPDGPGLANFVAFFEVEHQKDALVRSLGLAVSATVISSLIAWPLAYYVVFCVSATWRIFFLLLLMAPFWTSFTIRAFSWQLVLSDNGVISWGLRKITGLPVPLGFLYTMNASVFGLVLFGVMLTTLTLFGAMIAIDRRLIEACANLGGGPITVCKDIIAPLAMPGWAVGATLTFIICVGDYAVPTLLGGGLKPVLSQLMLSTVKGTYDLPTAATMAVLLVCVVALAALPIAIFSLMRRWRT